MCMRFLSCSAGAIVVLLASVGPQTVAGQTQAVPSRSASLESRSLDSIRFRLIGPNAPSGRVWNVLGVPSQPNTVYVCTCGGGVWRTTNYGATMTPIFDEQNGASCGAVAIAASNPNHVWVGTGEPAQRQSKELGYGVFKSTDGGKTWQHMGLEKTEEIAAIVIHPRDPQIVYVAAPGHLWGRNPERGVYKTVDGGRTWQRVLSVDDMSGAIDLVMDPRDPNVLYASTWQRMRSGGVQVRETGPGSGIYKTVDAGKQWTRLTNGLPNEPLSKITLAISSKTPDLIYAYIMSGEVRTATSGAGARTSDAGGVFRSDNGGATWRRVSPKLPRRTFFNTIRIDPNDDRRLWILDSVLWRSDDGGVTWVEHNMKNVHVDLHGLWIDPRDSTRLVLANDAGAHFSVDGGESWVQAVLPIGQFYEVDVDDQDPYWVYGGMQDTASWTGPSRTYDNEGITDHDWIKVRWQGDGMAIHPHPKDPNIIYAVQNDGETSRLDLRTWTRTEFQPSQARAAQLGLSPLRWNWTSPMIVSATDPDVIYLGAQYVFRCRFIPDDKPEGDQSDRCEAISQDLTRQQNTPFVPVGDGYHSYGTVFSLAQSPRDANVLWAGSDDGWIHVSRDAGKTWTRVDGNLPRGAHEEGFVSKIEPSRTGPGVAYVAFDLHYHDDPRPYLFKTTDFGATWTSITADLPVWGPTYVIREDPQNPRVLYVGTESGLFVSIDGGGHWVRWKSNLPHTAVRSLAIQVRDRDLVVGTFGRAIWVVDISPVEQLEEALRAPAFLFEPEPAVAYNVRHTYGTGAEAINGDLFFRGENPPFGTPFTYYLREDAGGEVRLLIKNAQGAIVRTLSGPATAGVHRVHWNLESDATRSAPSAPTVGGGLEPQPRRRAVPPGTYRVSLEAGGISTTRPVEVRSERPDGVTRVLPRK
jgi:photosystem II stability/assembly factor-like uncharacterized protein